MDIKFIGTGSAFTHKNWNTNLIIEKNGKNLLLDAGADVRHSMREAGLTYKDIEAVYISHTHADHAGGIEFLGFSTFFDPACKDKKIKLYGNGELLRKGWDNCWKGGMESVQGALLSLDSFFDVNMIRPNGVFTWENIDFQIVQSIHVLNGYAIVPCYGLMIRDQDSGKTIYWTSDVQFCPHQILDFYKQADVIIQDCETLPFRSGVHANYMDLITLSPEIKEKMILVHYSDNVLAADYVEEDGIRRYEVSKEWRDKVKADGFYHMPDRLEIIEVTENGDGNGL